MVSLIKDAILSSCCQAPATAKPGEAASFRCGHRSGEMQFHPGLRGPAMHVAAPGHRDRERPLRKAPRAASECGRPAGSAGGRRREFLTLATSLSSASHWMRDLFHLVLFFFLILFCFFRSCG